MMDFNVVSEILLTNLTIFNFRTNAPFLLALYLLSKSLRLRVVSSSDP